MRCFFFFFVLVELIATYKLETVIVDELAKGMSNSLNIGDFGMYSDNTTVTTVCNGKEKVIYGRDNHNRYLKALQRKGLHKLKIGKRRQRFREDEKIEVRGQIEVLRHEEIMFGNYLSVLEEVDGKWLIKEHTVILEQCQ